MHLCHSSDTVSGIPPVLAQFIPTHRRLLSQGSLLTVFETIPVPNLGEFKKVEWRGEKAPGTSAFFREPDEVVFSSGLFPT